MLGVGVVGSILSILWYRVTSGGSLDKDYVIGLVKLWMGFSIGAILFMLLYKYVLS